MDRKTYTITSEIHLEGKGIHSGIHTKINIKPSVKGTGVRYFRSDIDPNFAIIPDITNIHPSKRCTVIQKGNSSISTIEHLQAAIAALNIEDIEIHVSGPELPILDGSAFPFIEAFIQSNLVEIENSKEPFEVNTIYHFTDEETGSEYIIKPSTHLKLKTIIDLKNSLLGSQIALMDDISNFIEQHSKARTFSMLSNIEYLFDNGLIKGGDLENALVIIDKELDPDEESKLSQKFSIKNINKDKYVICSRPMINVNEPASHKLLDLLGDLTLLGRSVKAEIIAYRPSHASNAKLVSFLKEKYQQQKKTQGVPIFDPNQTMLLEVEDIKKILPHRYPFLLVDKIVSLESDTIVGIKNVTSNENFFQGHFPDNPIFPGVLQMEALAQVGGILALKSVMKEGEIWDTYFLKMDEVKFKSKVVPGDTLILKMKLVEPIRRGIVIMKGSAYVGQKLVSEGILTAQIVRRNND